MSIKLYAVFFGTKWGTTFDEKLALRTAKEKDGTVRVMNIVGVDESIGWDAPTFRALSDQIYPTVADPILPKAIC